MLDHYLKTEPILGNPVRDNDWTRLISPVADVNVTSCIRFKYYTNQASLKIMTESHDVMSLLASVPAAQTDKQWRQMYLPLSPGKYAFIFEVATKDPTQFVAGIDDVEVIKRPCQNLSMSSQILHLFESFMYCDINFLVFFLLSYILAKAADKDRTCKFDIGDNCNFIDASEQFPRWVINKELGDDSPGNVGLHFVFYHSYFLLSQSLNRIDLGVVIKLTT